jgi:MinD superfamily P-loop ATPase
MEFLTNQNLSLNKAGYLVSTESKKPVTHVEFVNQQKAAHYLVSLAEAIKDKNFVIGQIDNYAAIKAEVVKSINEATVVQYATAPAEPTSKVLDELIKYATDFDSYHDTKVSVSKINEFMNQFNKINDVEQVGDYFSEGLVKLNKIYTIEEILAAVKIQVEKLA